MNTLKLKSLEAKAKSLEGANKLAHDFLKELHTVHCKNDSINTVQYLYLALYVINHMQSKRRISQKIRLEIDNMLRYTFMDVRGNIEEVLKNTKLLDELSEDFQLTICISKLETLDILHDLLKTYKASDEFKLRILSVSNVAMCGMTTERINYIFHKYLYNKHGSSYINTTLHKIFSGNMSELEPSVINTIHTMSDILREKFE